MSNQNFKTGTIADVGYAEYKGKETFYLVLQDDKGNLADPIRGKGLEEVFNKAGDLKKGDVINLKDFGIDENTKKRIWEIERHEPYQELTNEISQDKEPVQQKSVDDIVKEAENAWKDKKERSLKDFEYIPDNIKNNYVGVVKNKFMGDEKINYYDKDDKSQMNIAFEDRKDSLNTSRQDEKTINAMLDLAESKGWKEIKLKGTEEFKQKAWLEASLRGIEVKGYKPSERDLAMLEASKIERSVNTVIAEKIENPAHEISGDFQNYKSIISNALAMKEIHYQKGYNPSEQVLNEKYFELDDDKDLRIKKALDFDVNEYKTHHYAIDKTSDTYFVKSMVENMNIPDNVKNEFNNNFNNRMTREFISNDNYDMPHENISLKSTAVLARYDLEKALDKLNINNKELVLKVYDEKMIDYSNQVNHHQKSFMSEKTKEVESVKSEPNQEKDFSAKEIAKDLAIETATVATTPTPLQPVVAGAFLAKDIKDIKEYVGNNLQDIPQKTEKEIKKDIKDLLQNGVRDGSIKERADVVEKLKEFGYEVLRENEKSITLSNPHGKDILLKGELFTKTYNAVKSLNDSLQPESVKEKYPNISDENIAKVNLWRENVLNRFDTVEARQNALSRLKDTLPDVASGKLDLGQPKFPANEIKPEIEVRTLDSGDQSRSR